MSYFLLLFMTFTLKPRALPYCPAILRHVEQLTTIPNMPSIFTDKDDFS